ncbi:hypothetical protein JKF63_02823 [Porcisia hertigi]|uniref:C2H2-type domain-containing protein n=1 Tax=Porcisia hertigi TaxID=2761500 RepID=A0A836HEF9_9TRYP|nr:hypothetical protein JKF63_02823 [Porcisia hertigi]
MLRRVRCRQLSDRCGGLSKPIFSGIGVLHGFSSDSFFRCALSRAAYGAGPLSSPRVPSPSPLRFSVSSPCTVFATAALRTSLRYASGMAGSPTSARSAANPLRFEPPSSMSHSGLAYAACPMCTRVVHMGQMLHHILSTHKEQDMTYWRRLCDARLALYERVTGAPLEGTETMHGASRSTVTMGGADVSDAGAMPSSGLSLNPPPSAHDALRPFLPTVSDAGTYTCNWCTVRRVIFSSRDAFLLHVAKDHPKLDFDVVESLVPQPPTTSSGAARSDGAEASSPCATTPSRGGVTRSDSWMPAQHCSAGSAGAPTAAQEAMGHLDVAYPVRRMPGVRTVEETNTLTLKLGGWRSGIGVGRIGERKFDPAPISVAGGRSRVATLASSTASSVASVGDLQFADGCFPCELCCRVFVSELNLLQHLESKHSNVTASAAGIDAPSAPVAATSLPGVFPSSSSSSSSPVELFVTCDHCENKGKFFRSSSALFSHIRFRHPAEDASYETERMIEEQKRRRVLQCPHCSYRHPDAARLEAHMCDAHRAMSRADSTGSSAGQSVLGAVQALGSTVLKAAQPSVFSSLPPLSPRGRFWCNACEKGFSNASALYAHTESKHAVVTRLYPCPACKREFRDIPSLESHINVFHKNLSLKDMGLQSSVECIDCQRHFLDYESLHEHAVRHHGKSPIAPVRSFQAPASVSTAEDGAGASDSHVVGVSTQVSGSTMTPPAVSAPPKPRKVTRRKKAS